MFAVLIFAFALFATSDVVYGKYERMSNGWIAVHKVTATWEDAYKQCQLEGAVLASPTTQQLRNAMQILIGENGTLHLLGTSARFINNIYVSVDGISINNMPVLDLITMLNPDEGQCLAMNFDSITVVPCSSQLPYMCYKKAVPEVSLTECGTYDKEYKLVNSTGSCYKIHYNLTKWGDAYATCIAEGGNLAVLNDHAEAQMLIKDIITVKTHYVLVGLEDWNGNDEWRSLQGHPIEEIYNDWVSDDKPSTIPRCATIDPDTAELKAFGNCLNTKFYFLCEKDPAFIQFSKEMELEPINY